MINADNASTTRLSDTALEKMLPYLREQYGNTSSAYSFGTKAKRAIENAGSQLLMPSMPTWMIYTSPQAALKATVG